MRGSNWRRDGPRVHAHAEARPVAQGRKALVTGADSGIGQGTAFELASHGAAVAVNYVADSTVAEEMGLEAVLAGTPGHKWTRSSCKSGL